jgi:hypothetical protein
VVPKFSAAGLDVLPLSTLLDVRLSPLPYPSPKRRGENLEVGDRLQALFPDPSPKGRREILLNLL